MILDCHQLFRALSAIIIIHQSHLPNQPPAVNEVARITDVAVVTINDPYSMQICQSSPSGYKKNVKDLCLNYSENYSMRWNWSFLQAG